jgi:tetratricopeptide (TPR) repeat protein
METLKKDHFLQTKIRLFVLIIIVSTFSLFTFWPALSCKALCFDDDIYFYNNYLVKNPSWDSAKTFLVEVLKPSTVGGYYQPLTMISLMIDYKMGGQEDSFETFHRTSLILHICNTALLTILLYQLFGNEWIAAAIGLLFSVHPLTVETIPWISERKTLLSAFFALSSLNFYVYYTRKEKVIFLIVCTLMYIFALMSKPISTPLPIMMLLMDYWPLKRIKLKVLTEKIHLGIICVISSVITYISQSQIALTTPKAYGFMRIPLIICHNIVFYLYKMIFPINLSSHYEMPDRFNISSPEMLIGIIGTGILLALLIFSLRRTRMFLTGFLIFFVMVFPTLQLFQFSDVIAANKFVYIPSVGIMMIIASVLIWIYKHSKIGTTQTNILLVVLILSLSTAESIATRKYLGYWQNTLTLFNRMVNLNPNSIYLLNHLGNGYFKEGDIDKATKCFKKSLAIKPDTSIYNNLASIALMKGEIDNASELLQKAIALDPRNCEAYFNIANIFLSKSDFDKAIANYEKAINLNPRYLKARANLAIAYANQGNVEKAIQMLKDTIQLDSENADLKFNLAMMLREQGNLDEAIKQFNDLLNVVPNNPDIHYNFAITLIRKGIFDEAITHFYKALELNPNNPEVHYSLAQVFAYQGKNDKAIEEYRQILKLEPQNPEIHCLIGDIFVKLENKNEAIAEYKKAIEIDTQNSHAKEGMEKLMKQ